MKPSRIVLSGVQAMLLSAFCFALMTLCVRMLPRIPAHEAVFFRALGMTAIGSLLLWQARIPPLGTHLKALVLRSLFGMMGLTSYFYTLKHMPLASAVTLQYLSPVFSTLLAIKMLGEPVARRRWVYFGLCLAGVVLVKGFDPRIALPMLGLSLFSAFCSGVAYNHVRSMRGLEHPYVILFYFSGLNLVLIAPYTLSHWVMPMGSEWLWLAAMALLTHLAQLLLTSALQSEAMAVVTPLNYTGVIYALLFGWYLFGEAVTVPALAGMALIIAGVILAGRKTAAKPRGLNSPPAC
ncbi:MAG: EamA family transporter [Candidatus Melainabacteria bacterium HGW-Melainabacteria-1]|nr:MAG: EamA family transporter [Candidatus Melainabacteria bacterium HGW-Melainabacteria-1]